MWVTLKRTAPFPCDVMESMDKIEQDYLYKRQVLEHWSEQEEMKQVLFSLSSQKQNYNNNNNNNINNNIKKELKITNNENNKNNSQDNMQKLSGKYKKEDFVSFFTDVGENQVVSCVGEVVYVISSDKIAVKLIGKQNPHLNVLPSIISLIFNYLFLYFLI